ncbi:MAG: hypothetical protein OEW39_14155, partial [Deltaproteobacteria bacterium]|nr:hypothetical protein [Deltaproteobacteria bacterium]
MSSGPDSASPHTQMATWSDRFGIHPSALETLRCGMEALGHPEENIQLLEALLNNASDAGIAPEWLEPPHAAEALGRLAYAAPFLVRYLSAHPAALTLGVLDNLEQGPALAPWVLFADPATAADLPEETFIQALRLWKYAGYVRFTARELLGFQTTQSTCREISRLAEGMIRMSFAHAFRRGVLSNGLPLLGPGELAAGGVVGMGKLGGQELNYSSDVDVIFIQEGTDHPCWTVAHLPPQTLHPDMDENGFWSLWETLARGMTTGEAGRFSSGEFYNRLARQSMRLLALPTQEGFGFRVDADLRPQGKSGLLAPTLNFMEDYYLRLGREWERTAMLKARLIAGPPRLGTAFSKIIQPFVFQRYLDYSALEGVAIVKHDINRMHQNALKGNIKLGRGGIRENEFLVQALQLLYGGKRPGLQVQGHAATVDALVKEKLIEPEDGQAMLRDYWRLRGVENRIQMVAEAQTHELPPDPAERRRVLHDFHPAFETRLPEVESALEATRERIAGRFETLFRGLGEVGFPEADLWQDAVRAHLPEADLAPSLEFINTLFSGVMTTRMGERCVFKLARLLTLPELYRLGTEPAFPRWLRFMEQIGNRNALYTLIDSNRGIVPWVSHIFSEGGVHAELLMRHPEFLESFFAITESWDDPREHFQTLLANAPDEEAFLLELQSSKAQHQIRILTQYLNPQAPGEHHRLLSDLADAVIEACLRYAWQKVGSRMGFPEGARGEPQGFAVVALGKLGSQEMRFSSDLDLVFLYRGEGRTDQGRSH